MLNRTNKQSLPSYPSIARSLPGDLFKRVRGSMDACSVLPVQSAEVVLNPDFGPDVCYIFPSFHTYSLLCFLDFR